MMTSLSLYLALQIYNGTYAPYPAGGFTGISSGAHKVWVKNAAGCEASVDVTVGTAPGAPVVTATATDQTCATPTGTITVTSATAGLEYKVDNGTYAPYPAGGFTGISSGAHKVWVKNAAGCEASVDVTVGTAPGAPTVTATATDPTCATPTGTITVTSATAGLEYKVDNGTYAPYPAGGFTGISSGAHKVWVKNAAGCEASVDVTVGTAPGAPTVTATATDPTCATPTGTITVTSATAGLEYKVDNGTYAPYPAGGFTGISSGAHKVWVKNAAGCEASVDVTVGTAPGAPTVTATATDPTCATPTGTITVTSATAGLEYKVDNGTYAPYPAGGFTGISSGAHKVWVKNAAGCEASVDVTVGTAPGAPTVTATATDPTCATPTGTITVTSATAGLEYKVDNGTYAPYPAGGFTGISSGAHKVWVKNAAGCEASVDVTVGTAPGAPTVTATATDPTCATPTGTITVTSATAGLEYKVDNGTYAPYPAGGFTGISSGAHKVWVKNAAGCEASVDVTVGTAPGAPTVTATATDPTCATPTGTITVTSATAGLEYKVDNGTYAPYPAGGFTGISSGAHKVWVKNAAGCEASVDVTVGTAPGAPTVTATATDPTCATPTGTITVTSATAGLEYKVDNGTYAPYPAGGFTGISSGAHKVWVKNAAGCEATADITIGNAPGAPVVTLAKVDPTCTTPTGTITVTSATAGLEYKVDNGTYAPYPAGGFTGISTGAHKVWMKNEAGC